MHHRTSRTVAAAALAAACALTASAGTAAAAVRPFGPAKIVSVDGPDLLTITNQAGQSLPLHLIGIDTPQPGECGATEAQAALQGIAGGTLKNLGYVIARTRKSGLAHDAGGRYLARLHYREQGSYAEKYDVASRLVDTGWARSGFTATLDSLPPKFGELTAQSFTEDQFHDKTGAVKGLWSKCGGRAHLPATQIAPAATAMPWVTDTSGITKSIGPLTLPATLTPESALTVRSAAALAGPTEVVRFEGSCFGYVPSLEIAFYAWTTDRGDTCGNADVQAILSYGPDPATTDRGLRAGDRTGDIRAKYPLVDSDAVDYNTDSVPLGGIRSSVWAWQTYAGLNDKGRVGSLITYGAGPVLE